MMIIFFHPFRPRGGLLVGQLRYWPLTAKGQDCILLRARLMAYPDSACAVLHSRKAATLRKILHAQAGAVCDNG
jgi:hypothetical protein